MHGKRGERHYSIQASSPKVDKSLKLQFNLESKFQKKTNANKIIKASPNRVLSFTSHSSSSQSVSSQDNDDYYEDFLRNIIYEKKKSRSHKASKNEIKALKEKLKKQSKNKKSLFEEKRKKNRRTTQIKLQLAEVQEEKNSNVNTISIVHPQRNMNQFLSIKNEESFSINETKKENKIEKVAEEIKLNKEMNSKSKAKDDNILNIKSKAREDKENIVNSKSKSPKLNKDNNPNKFPVTIYKDMGLSYNLQENKSKKPRRQSVFDNHIGLRENSNNFDEYILQSINKKPRLSISPVRMKRDKMIKLINKKDNSNDNWKNTNWGQIPNAGFIKKKTETESLNIKDKRGAEKKEEANNNNKKKGNQIEKQATPQIDTPSKQSSITKNKKKHLFCCIPIK